MNESIDDPFEVLGISRDASEESIRATYLELVKKFPPERDPEKFRQIQAAYAAAKDPLQLAQRLLDSLDPDDIPEWSDAIDEHEKRPPKLKVDFLLSLGNRSDRAASPSSLQRDSSPDSADDSTVNENSQQLFVDPAHD